MTKTQREEAIHILQKEVDLDWFPNEKTEALKMALTALRPVSREQVEKVWRGEWEPVGDDAFYRRCSKCGKMAVGKRLFCPNCGAPTTDEAVDMVMERMEAITNATD